MLKFKLHNYKPKSYTEDTKINLRCMNIEKKPTNIIYRTDYLIFELFSRSLFCNFLKYNLSGKSSLPMLKAHPRTRARGMKYGVIVCFNTKSVSKYHNEN